MENAERTHCCTFEPFRFDAAIGELHGPDGSIKLRPQATLALDLLLSRRGEIVSKDELREVLWPDERIVMFEASIAAVIRELRRTLADDAKAPRFIETVPKRGYRFVAQPVEEDGSAAMDNASPRRNRRGGLFLACQFPVLMLLMGGATQLQPHSYELLNATPVTVVVLPFKDLTRLPDQGILAQTLPGELVAWLGAMAPEQLCVVDRTGAAGGGAAPLPDGRPADFVVLGSVRDDREAVLVSVKLLGGAEGRFTWGEHYRRNAGDAGLTAREIAARIADRVASKSLPRWRNGSAPATANVAAANAFRRGNEAFAQLSREGTIEAVDAFREAIELDPAFSEGYAQFGAALTGWPGPPITPDRVEQARHAALSSIELVPTNAVGHRVLGEIGLYYDRDWQLAERHLVRSIELSPSDAAAHHSYAAWLSARGRHGEALREIDLAAALEPGSVTISIDTLFLHFYARDFEGAISAAQRLKQLWPGNQASPRYSVLSRLATGDVPAAVAEARKCLANPNMISAPLASAAALPDDKVLEAFWRASLQLEARSVSEHSGDPTTLAMVNVQLGRLDAANSALESALSSPRFSYFLPYLGVSPAFDRMCGHPGFERILRRLRQSALRRDAGLPRCAAVIASSAGDTR